MRPRRLATPLPVLLLLAASCDGEGSPQWTLDDAGTLADVEVDFDPGGDPDPLRVSAITEVFFDCSSPATVTGSCTAPGSTMWPLAWSDDGHQYTSWTDGGGFCGSDDDGRVSLGFGRIEGRYTFGYPGVGYYAFNVSGGAGAENPATLQGRCAGLTSAGGTLWALVNTEDSASGPSFRLAWSSDHGASWEEASWTWDSGLAAPSSFLNFGRDGRDARDDFVYAFGGIWESSDGVYLFRAPVGGLAEEASWELFSGSAEDPSWSRSADDAVPVLVHEDLGVTPNAALVSTGIYLPNFERFVAAVPLGPGLRPGFFEAPEPWGPWTLVTAFDPICRLEGDASPLPLSVSPRWLLRHGNALGFVMTYSNADYDGWNTIEGTFAGTEE